MPARPALADAPHSCRAFLNCVENSHTAEERARAAVADRGGLTRFPLAAVERAAQHVGLWSSDRFHRPPEVRRRRLVGDITNHAVELAAADAVEPLAGELEVVALHVDGPRLVADDVDAVVDPGNQLLGRRPVGSGLQRYVGHPPDRRMQRRVGEGATVGPGLTRLARDPPVELVADQDAVLDDVPGLRLHTFVVPADRRQTVLGLTVSG